ncbi:MAG: YbjN domain-containing protein [Eggerthellaceae bacterium]|nr:YbjN domain-containing protein [Eggerthellaceae bacterium]
MNYGIAIAALFSAYLETNRYKHRHDEDSDIVVIGFVGNYESFDGITILMKFGADGEDVQIQAPDFAVVPEAGHAQAMFACNKVNERYRWVKFAVSEGGAAAAHLRHSNRGYDGRRRFVRLAASVHETVHSRCRSRLRHVLRICRHGHYKRRGNRT